MPPLCGHNDEPGMRRRPKRFNGAMSVASLRRLAYAWHIFRCPAQLASFFVLYFIDISVALVSPLTISWDSLQARHTTSVDLLFALGGRKTQNGNTCFRWD